MASLRKRLITLTMVATVPFLAISIYLIISMFNYSQAYDKLISNMTIANSYNLVFKEQVDESTYKLVVGAVTFEDIGHDPVLRNPYLTIRDMRLDFDELMHHTHDKESKAWIQSLLRNLDTLEDRIDDIKINLDEGGHYDTNIQMLDDNIYILTELVQDDLQHYIYYQAINMEKLQEALNQRVRLFLAVSLVVVILILLGVVIIATRLASGITKPLHNLVKATEQIAQGDFSAEVGQSGTKELNQLSDSVNEMAGKLSLLVEQIKIDEQKMRGAELRLLQEQINPHFLYNTLDTIVWLIEGGMEKEAEAMVVSLSNFFRLVLSKGREYISIEDEKKHIQSYLEIQKVRYQDILEYEIAIPEEIYEFSILKLTLQPLVENALYHGIKYKRAKGTITITGEKKQDTILLTVADNGVGMDEETQKKLQQEINRPCKETDSGFGLANVNERIKMNYGKEYGISVHSVKGEGTVVEVKIPARPKALLDQSRQEETSKEETQNV